MAYRSQAGACSLRVPVYTTNPKGDWIEGFLDIPLRFCRSAPDTNERHTFDRLVTEALDRWTSWRAKRGWFINSRPTVRGPYELPTGAANQSDVLVQQRKAAGVIPDDEEAHDEKRRYYVRARFLREEPLFVGLDDVIEQMNMHQRYGLSPEAKDYLPHNDLSGTEDTGWVDPLKEAEESRQRQGLKLSDYRIPEWWQACDDGHIWTPRRP